MYKQQGIAEERRKKEEAKVLLCLSFKLLICSRPLLRLLYQLETEKKIFIFSGYGIKPLGNL
ncbi:MAG: hypothetical protein F6K17_41830 [Okeania sp. SIO3C4]|nr:hypothetical protein [Okeania sp. SIO3C4]